MNKEDRMKMLRTGLRWSLFRADDRFDAELFGSPAREVHGGHSAENVHGNHAAEKIHGAAAVEVHGGHAA